MRAAAVLALLVAGPAGAADCDKRDAVIAGLATRYGETRQIVGLAGEVLMELFASSETGTWTITLTLPGGLTCLVAAGSDFENLPEPPAPPNL